MNESISNESSSPRFLVLLWCLYLLGIWLFSLQLDNPLWAGRWMFWCLLMGLMLLWPALRLSQTIMSPARIWIDWACLTLVFETVCWPLKIILAWSLPQMLWLNASVLSWSLLAGLFTAAGCRSSYSRHRSAAMFLCVGVLLIEPLLQLLLGIPWTMRVSPIQTVSSLLQGEITPLVQVHILSVAIGSAIGWFLLWHHDCKVKRQLLDTLQAQKVS